MFDKPFTFEGRIRRLEYGLSIIIYIIVYLFFSNIITSMGEEALVLYFLILIPALWFIWAQGAKRCHDLGDSGWYQLIPFYGFLLLFREGEAGENRYGDNPKGIGLANNQNLNSGQNYGSTDNPPAKTGSAIGYQGGYQGGHNSSDSYPSVTKTGNSSKEYKKGDLYN